MKAELTKPDVQITMAYEEARTLTQVLNDSSTLYPLLAKLRSVLNGLFEERVGG